MIVLAVDPGKTTGWAWNEGEVNEAFADTFLDLLDYWPTPHVVVCEQYDITKETLKKSRGERAWSIEQIGVLRQYARKGGAMFVLQRARDAKALVTDERLQALGLWHPTPGGHTNDALRHLVMYLAKQGEMRIPT